MSMTDVTRFHLLNVIDSCAVSNVLSSKRLSTAAHSAGCHFCCTYFVEYEVLHKRHTIPSPEKAELQSRFRAEQAKGHFPTFHLDLDDLQEVEVLRNRKRLSMGELSSIAFAKKTRQAFLTDDQKARRLAGDVMDISLVQTTPRLFGWLMFTRHLTDADKHDVVEEHKRFGRPLAKWFEETYLDALRFRLTAGQNDS